jgi:hypothetical protein
MRYQQPYGVTDINAPYVNGNPAAGIQGSIPPAAAFEQPQREIVAVIQNNDFTPTDNDLQQLVKSVRRQYVNYAIDSGAVNSLVVALTPALDTYHAGLPLRVLVANTNTGATVINVNNLGTRAIKRGDNSDLHAGDLVAGMIAYLVDNGTCYQLQNPLYAVAQQANNYYINIPYVADTGTANNIVAPFSPAIAAVTEGEFISVKVKATNTGATKITVNALAPIPIKRDDGADLVAGDLLANEQILLENHSSYWQVLGLVRSQVLQPPAPTLRGIIVTMAGYGAQTIPTSSATNLAYYNVIKNNLKTSTFDGVNLTIGAGEDGVWMIYASVHMQQVGAAANYAQMIIFNRTTGDQLATESSGSLSAGTGLSMSANSEGPLNVGHVINAAFYHQVGINWSTQPDSSMRFSAWLISK